MLRRKGKGQGKAEGQDLVTLVEKAEKKVSRSVLRFRSGVNWRRTGPFRGTSKLAGGVAEQSHVKCTLVFMIAGHVKL